MKFEAVWFDSDGVLVNSEPITNGVLRDMLYERGRVLTVAECMRQFVGKAVKDEAALTAQRTGEPVTEAWLEALRDRRNTALAGRRGSDCERSRCRKRCSSAPQWAHCLRIGCGPLQGRADAAQAGPDGLF